MTTRRSFLGASIGAGLLGLSGSAGLFAQSGSSRGGLSILILGGTGFIGPHLVSYAMQRGHRITLARLVETAAPFGQRDHARLGRFDADVEVVELGLDRLLLLLLHERNELPDYYALPPMEQSA